MRMAAAASCKAAFATYGGTVLLLLAVISTGCRSHLGRLASPPPDFYAPLVVSELPLTTSSSDYTFAYVHKYPGDYEVKIRIPELEIMKPLERASCDFLLALEVMNASGVVATLPPTSVADGQYYAAMHDPICGVGVVMLSYTVPERLVGMSEFTCRARVENRGSKFTGRYGTPVLIVIKAPIK